MATSDKRQAGTRGRPGRMAPGAKRDQILEVAWGFFGRDGYEDTKWADVATEVGVGSTGLYHYFESKQHSLYEIMARAVGDFRTRFDAAVAAHPGDYTEALLAVLADTYDLTDQEVLRNRVLVAEQGLVSVQRKSPREEAARLEARSGMRDLEFAWGTFLARGMQEGVVLESDPRLLTRALLGLYNSIWHWYRPGGGLSLHEVGEFYLGCQLALLGLSPELAAGRVSGPPTPAS